MFMIIEQSDICSFADDITLYSCGERLTEIKENLICDTKSIFRNSKNLVKSSIVVALQPVDCKSVTLVKRELTEISRSATLWN